MNLTELNPPPVIARFDGHALELRNFDLEAMVWASQYFQKDGKDGLDMMNHYLNDYKNFKVFSDVVTEIIFYLMSDDDREDIFQDSSCYFKRMISETLEKDGGSSRTIAIFFDALQKVFSNSLIQTEKKEQPNIPESIRPEREEPEPEDWAKVFVVVAGAIGCTMDEFYSFTIQQIDAIRTQINIAKFDDFKVQASIKGIKLQNNFNSMPQKVVDKWSDDDISTFEKLQEAELKGLN